MGKNNDVKLFYVSESNGVCVCVFACARINIYMRACVCVRACVRVWMRASVRLSVRLSVCIYKTTAP